MGVKLSHFLNPYLGLWKPLLVAAAVWLGAVVAPRFVDRWFRTFEAAWSRFASRKHAAIWTVFLAPIVIRSLLLPVIGPPVPGVHDEFSYLLLGDTFAHGRLTNPPHPMWMSFETFHINWLPTYHSMFPPAQGFFLAAGQLLGHPWVGVVLSVGTMCAAVFWMLQVWMPARWALLGAAMAICNLGIVSYWMDSYWGGAVAATGGALVLGALPRVLRRQQVRDSLLLGLGMAVLANSRPVEGFILSLPVAAMLMYRLGTEPSLRTAAPRILAPLAGVLFLLLLFTGYYNWRLTGDALLFPHYLNDRTYFRAPLFLWQYAQPSIHYHNRQFEDFYNGPIVNNFHGTWRDIAREGWHKVSLSWAAFFWCGALPALLCVPLVLRDRRVRFLLIEFLICAAGLLCVVYFEPHYAAPLTCVIYALLVQGLRHLRTLRCRGRRIGVGLSRAVVLLLLITAVSGPYHLIRYPKSPYPWSWDRGGNSPNKVAEHLKALPGKHLVVVRYDLNHNPNGEWVYNGADIDGSKIVWARELDATQNAKLVSYFKDRQIWLFEPDRDPAHLRPYPVLAPFSPP